MVFSYILILIFSLLTLQLFQLSQSATMVVDGVSVWKNPQLQIGDSVVFQHKYHYSLYIFKNEEAFSLCNFTKASILTKPNSSIYTWHTSRPGFFYFSFYNGSNRACLEGQKLAVKVTSSPPAAAPLPSTTPPPSAGGFVASSPAFPWPFQPRGGAASPSPAPAMRGGAASPVAPEKEGIPFINSNPAVPLPTGEVDSATIRPLPTSGYQHSIQVSFSDLRIQPASSAVSTTPPPLRTRRCCRSHYFESADLPPSAAAIELIRGRVAAGIPSSYGTNS